MNFDYKTAWKELAAPAYESLPKEIHHLVSLVGERCAKIHQNSDLLLSWPEDGGELQHLFEDTTLKALSIASRAVYFYGHWAPSGSPVIKGVGTNWKFSIYADMTLRKALISQPRDGAFYQIHEGVVRVCYSSRNCWMWEEVALASDIDLVRQEVKKLSFSERDFNISALKLLHRVGLANEVSAPWLQKGKFMTPETDREKLLVKLKEIQAPPLWLVDDITSINFKPHPFTIGSEHMKRGSIDTTVGCAHRDRSFGKCGLPPEAHTSESVVSLLYLGDDLVLNNDTMPKDWLMSLKDAAEGNKIEGFIFPNCRKK